MRYIKWTVTIKNYYGWDDIEDDKLPSPILFDELLANPPRCSATKKV